MEISEGMKAHKLTRQGIPRRPADPELDQLEARKSNLLLEVMLAQAQGQGVGQTDTKYAEAAMIEERLRDACLAMNLRETAWVHAFSAASCWAQAGDFFHAVTVCDAMLREPDLNPRLRESVARFAQTIRDRRTAFLAELRLQDMEKTT